MEPEKKPDFRITSHSEGRTGGGQLVRFGCRQGAVDEVKRFLKENIRDFSFPESHRVNVSHGSFGRYSRFDATQHKYAAGDGEDGSWSYVELLEIKNVPDERCGIILHRATSHSGSAFYEWDSLESGQNAFEAFFRKQGRNELELLSQQPGFLRHVHCGDLSPWFYAVGNQDIIGDYAFPEGMQDDQFYKVGDKFIVYDRETGMPVLKTCLGCRFVQPAMEGGGYYAGSYSKSYEVPAHRIVYWSDGTSWSERDNPGRHPVRAHEGELWIAEAMAKFQALLAGNSEAFTINFADGSKFVGKVILPDEQKPSPAGKYHLKVKLAGEAKLLEGFVDFEPTSEAANIVQYVTNRYEEAGRKVETIQVAESKPEKGGKKWQGVYYSRNP